MIIHNIYLKTFHKNILDRIYLQYLIASKDIYILPMTIVKRSIAFRKTKKTAPKCPNANCVRIALMPSILHGNYYKIWYQISRYALIFMENRWHPRLSSRNLRQNILMQFSFFKKTKCLFEINFVLYL